MKKTVAKFLVVGMALLGGLLSSGRSASAGWLNCCDDCPDHCKCQAREVTLGWCTTESCSEMQWCNTGTGTNCCVIGFVE